MLPVLTEIVKSNYYDLNGSEMKVKNNIKFKFKLGEKLYLYH